MTLRYTLLFAFVAFWTIGCTQTHTSGETTAEPAIEQLKPNAFQEKWKEGNATLLDVRTPAEVAQGMIAGAKHINVHDKDFDSRIKELDLSKPVFVYCKSGGRSMRAAKMLQDAGCTLIYNLDGGITAWQSTGLPTEQPSN